MNSRAKNRTPATPAIHIKHGNDSQLVDTQEFETKDLDKSVTLDADMTIEQLRDSLNSNVSTDINTKEFKKFAGNMKFFDEQVLIRVLPSSEKNAEIVIDVYNDGIPQRFIRGQWVIAKRRYVEVLARSKPFGVTTPEIVDGNGDRTTSIDITHGTRYPFEMRDKNPFGQGWLQSILQEA